MRHETRIECRGWRLASVVALTLLVAACGGGGGGGSSGSSSNTTTPTNTTTSTTTTSSGGGGTTTSGIPLTAALQQGTYWDFAANTETQSFAQGNGTSSTTAFGLFRLTLGAATTIGGRTVYPITVTGKSTVGTTDFKPRWTHIGISGGSVFGSADGSTIQTIYDGTSTNATAAGFFVTFAANETVKASASTFTGQYNTLSAVLAGHSTASGGCQQIVGLTICSDTSTSFSEKEYYKDGLGPIAYTLNISYSSSGGGFFTSTKITRTVEIVGTSLTAADAAVIKPPPWNEVAALTTGRKNATASVYNGEIYVFGGNSGTNTNLSSVEIYNPASNAWRAGVSAPISLGGAYKAKTVGSKTYLIGSNVAVRIFDHLTSTWSTGAVSPFNDPSFDVDVWTDSVSGKTFVIAVPSKLWTGLDVLGYEVAGNQWYYGISGFTFTDHRWQAIAVIGNVFYVAGGYRQSQTTKVFNGTYSYNLATDAWSSASVGTLKVPRYSAAAVNLNGSMVLLGGTDGTVNLRDVESFNPASGTWTLMPKMLSARNYLAAAVLGSKLYAIGGDPGDGSALSTVEVYSP